MVAATQIVIAEITAPAHQKTTVAAIVATICKIKIVAVDIKIVTAVIIAIAQPNIIVGVIATTKKMGATVETIVIAMMTESVIVIMMIVIVTTNQAKKIIKNCLQNFNMH